MVFFTGILTLFMVLDCLVLILLVLMQLPKKEAGAGLAFGAAATDALFGAGSGNFLTKATKYAAIIFFAGAVILSVLENHQSGGRVSELQRQIEKHQSQIPSGSPDIGGEPAAPAAARTPAPDAAAAATPGPSNNFSLTIPKPETAPAVSSTNPAAPKK